MDREVSVVLEDGTPMVIVAEQIGPALVSTDDVVAKLSTVASSIEQASREVLNAVKRVAPTKGTVEIAFGIAIESGQLVAMFGKGKADASVKVTLEWSPPATAPAPAPEPS